jgi:hypothetical protein
VAETLGSAFSHNRVKSVAVLAITGLAFLGFFLRLSLRSLRLCVERISTPITSQRIPFRENARGDSDAMAIHLIARDFVFLD